MKILHIDASARRDGSDSRALSQYFLDCLAMRDVPCTVDRLDLADNPPPHFDALQTAAIYLSADEQTPAMAAALALSDGLCARILAADAIVCGTPMYNFGIPSALKSFADHISRPDITFVASETGIEGKLGGKRAVFLLTSGGDYRPGAMFEGMDCATPNIKAVFGFLGLTDLEIVHAQPIRFGGPDVREAALEEARRQAEAVASVWAKH